MVIDFRTSQPHCILGVDVEEVGDFKYLDINFNRLDWKPKKLQEGDEQTVLPEEEEDLSICAAKCGSVVVSEPATPVGLNGPERWAPSLTADRTLRRLWWRGGH